MRRQVDVTANADMKLAALTKVDAAQLRAEWQRLYRAQPPRRASRKLLELGVVRKLQERAHGGLSAAVTRRKEPRIRQA